MDIEDAFTEQAITAADTNTVGEEEETLRDVIVRIYATNEITPPPTNDAVNIAMLCFVAGRTFEHDLMLIQEEGGPMTVTLSEKAVGAFLNLLLEERADGGT